MNAKDKVVIVLVEPQDPINVGNTVRAMKNMGLSRLRLVRPANANPSAVAISAPRADDIISTIEIHETLDGALADTVMTVAMTARQRRAKQVFARPREAAVQIAERTADGKVAIMFGREDSGLPNEAIDRAHTTVIIPTRPDYSSLNLGQAVLLMAYEVFMATTDVPELRHPKRDFPPATADQLQGMYQQIEETLWGIDFFKSGVSTGIMRSLGQMFNRAVLDEREVRMLRGIFVEVLKYAQRASKR